MFASAPISAYLQVGHILGVDVKLILRAEALFITRKKMSWEREGGEEIRTRNQETVHAVKTTAHHFLFVSNFRRAHQRHSVLITLVDLKAHAYA